MQEIDSTDSIFCTGMPLGLAVAGTYQPIDGDLSETSIPMNHPTDGQLTAGVPVLLSAH